MERLFVDTSAWFAHVNRSDPDHASVRDVLRRFEGRLVTTNFVFDEIVTLIAARSGHAPAATVGRLLLDGKVADLVRVTATDEREAWTLFVDRPDKSYSYTDCTSFTVMRRLGVHRAATLDEDFAREGFDTVPANVK
jgi:hypothetical protein